MLAPVSGASPSRGVVLAGHLSWLVVGVTFVMLLGGTHPSNAGRDRTLLVASLLVAALNVPIAVWSVKASASAEWGPARLRTWALIVSRLALAACAFVFIHGISHEQRDDPWSSKDAWRSCAPHVDRWQPARPTPPCSALHMCANEAPLDRMQMTKLREMVRATPGCSEL